MTLAGATYAGLAACFMVAIVYAWLETLLRYRNVKANLVACLWVWVYVLVNAAGADVAYLALISALRSSLSTDPTVGFMLVVVASISSWGIFTCASPAFNF